jgi:hypothetical protein
MTIGTSSACSLFTKTKSMFHNTTAWLSMTTTRLPFMVTTPYFHHHHYIARTSKTMMDMMIARIDDSNAATQMTMRL